MKSAKRTFCAAALAASFFVSSPVLFAAGPANSAAANPAAVSQDDQQFLDKVWNINATEIRLGNDAQQKATNADVKAFGKMTVTDHTQLQQELTALAAQHGVTLPTTLDATHQQLVDRLDKLSGSDFDKQYMTAMISGHEKAVAAFEKQVQDKAQTPADKWAAGALPTIQHHLDVARKTGKEVGATDEEASNAVPASGVQHGSK